MKKIIISFLPLILLVGACKEIVEIDIKDANPILVVESEVSTETDSSYVKLSLSKNYYESGEMPVVSTAIVSINGVPFVFNPSLQLYKPSLGYVGKTDSVYQLNIRYDNKDYSAQSILHPMFRIDSFFQTFKAANGPLPEGYSISYSAFDSRPTPRYTAFNQGYFDTIVQRDSMVGNTIVFDNILTPVSQQYNFEIPFVRLNSGDIYIAIFKSIDSKMRDFLEAYSSQNPNIPGPFQVPPANLPSNVTGGAVGYFSASDVKRWRYTVK
jgi:hypothetical protein